MTLVEGRPPEVVAAEEVPIAEQLAGRGFPVDVREGDVAQETVIRTAPQHFDGAVLLAQNLSWTPRVEVVDGLGDAVELVLGEDFQRLLLAPRDLAVVEAEARAWLPGVLLDGDGGEAATVGGGRWSLPRVDIDVDGRPPEGVSCP